MLHLVFVGRLLHTRDGRDVITLSITLWLAQVGTEETGVITWSVTTGHYPWISALLILFFIELIFVFETNIGYRSTHGVYGHHRTLCRIETLGTQLRIIGILIVLILKHRVNLKFSIAFMILTVIVLNKLSPTGEVSLQSAIFSTAQWQNILLVRRRKDSLRWCNVSTGSWSKFANLLRPIVENDLVWYWTFLLPHGCNQLLGKGGLTDNHTAKAILHIGVLSWEVRFLLFLDEFHGDWLGTQWVTMVVLKCFAAGYIDAALH